MYPSRQDHLNPSLEHVRTRTASLQPDYDPEPDYDNNEDGQDEIMPPTINPSSPVYEEAFALPRDPPADFDDMESWDPSRLYDGDPMEPDAFKKDPRFPLNVGQFLDEDGEELPLNTQVPYYPPERQGRARRNSPQRDARNPQRHRRDPQERRNLLEEPERPMQPEVLDLSPRRKSSAFAGNILDPLRRRRSSGRTGIFEPNKQQRRNDTNFDDLNDRRKDSIRGLGFNDPNIASTSHLVPPHRDSVYSVGSEVQRTAMDPEEDEDQNYQFAPENAFRNRYDSESTNHYTMRDAVKIARALQLMEEHDSGQLLEPAEAMPQENDISSPDGFNKVAKRQCWTRYCQSQGYHAHVMRRTGGVTNEVDGRERLQAHYGKHVTSKASWHMNQTKTWVRFKERIGEIVGNFAVWHHSLKHIEGHFGTSIASYFIFIRWLFLLNVVIFIIMFAFVVFPYLLKDWVLNNYENGVINVDLEADKKCALHYYTQKELQNKTKIEAEVLTDFLQGTGWMERTSMFIGMYKTVTLNVEGITYSLPLAYLLAGLAVLLLSLIIMLRSTAKGFKESVITSEGHLYNYCNTVFGGWDFCINRPEAATLKHEMLTTELISCLEDEKRKRERQNRTRKERVVLYAIRISVWLIILSMLGGSGFGIYKSSNYSLNQTNSIKECQSDNDNNGTSDKQEQFKALVIEYLPTMVITALNVALPLFFYELVEFEKYSPATLVKVNLFRTLLLRLASIGVLLYTFQDQISRNYEDGQNTCNSRNTTECGKIPCWETYVGQQLYKLVLLDFIVILIITFGFSLLRMFLTTKLDIKFFKWIGREEFDIPKHVLDLVYSQTLCWLGTFFSPLLPAACVVKCLLMFYIKKFHLFINCVPSRQPYRASKSNAVFITVLLISFGLFALVPFVYSIAELRPSKSCGPFRTKNVMWEVVEEIPWPPGIQHIFTIVGSSMFAVPVIILLMLVIYYYYTISASYKNMSIVLKDHLMMEGQDKQFLLERLNDVTIRMFGQSNPGQNPKVMKPALQSSGNANHYGKGDGNAIETAYF